MGFLSDVSEGFRLFTDSMRLMVKRPILLVPIFFSWALVAAIVLYFRYYFVAPPGFSIVLMIIFGAVFGITMIISIANLMMLEILQQMERGKDISLMRAVQETFTLDLIKAIPVAFVWAIIWFILMILRALTSKKKGGSRAEPSPRDAALTLSGANSGPFTWVGLGLSMFEKLLRMYVFLALPAIAWEDKGPGTAFAKSSDIIKRHPVQFLTTYSLTGFASMLMALPIIPILLLDKAGMVFPNEVWFGVIIYEGVIWTFSMYLEQMSVAMLYLWHMKWEKRGGQGELTSVEKPDFMDNVYELR